MLPVFGEGTPAIPAASGVGSGTAFFIKPGRSAVPASRSDTDVRPGPSPLACDTNRAARCVVHGVPIPFTGRDAYSQLLYRIPIYVIVYYAMYVCVYNALETSCATML